MKSETMSGSSALAVGEVVSASRSKKAIPCLRPATAIRPSCSAAAGRGVHLNRNWSVDWGKKEKVHAYF
ncbi:hypothetical protein Taro_029790 [Colocasia esculenta]|uniref:Uncharacterized protein n=1 Tax=Colocasia esculenta TaxID=4460 RepID=A0A843VQ28_COLES|nr:hypothetical protein [Colocasia esculenta]